MNPQNPIPLRVQSSRIQTSRIPEFTSSEFSIRGCSFPSREPSDLRCRTPSSEFSLQAAPSHRDQASDLYERDPEFRVQPSGCCLDSCEASDLPSSPEVWGWLTGDCRQSRHSQYRSFSTLPATALIALPAKLGNSPEKLNRDVWGVTLPELSRFQSEPKSLSPGSAVPPPSSQHL